MYVTRATVRRRIIPARAGFTRVRDARHRPTADHPRSRGVYWPPWRRKCATQGSSPLARGLRRLTGQLGGLDGIIPARAGFTSRRPPTGRSSRDHPRSRGVYHFEFPFSCSRLGSSPLARGLPGRKPARKAEAGIIPARAGFTQSGRAHDELFPDHPRSRGVYADATTADDAVARIIPARAGFTESGPPMRQHLGDHPRSRGVYPLWATPYESAYGSSPLARGLPCSRQYGR